MFESPPKPRRRWFRYSLRTMFVVVTILSVPLGFVAYQLNWIQNRNRELQLDKYWPTDGPEGEHPSNVSYAFAYLDYFTLTPGTQRPAAPELLGMFGERGYAEVDIAFNVGDMKNGKERQLTLEELKEVERVKRLFPEAEVFGTAYVALNEDDVYAETETPHTPSPLIDLELPEARLPEPAYSWPQPTP
jgi:hypothetical protein